MTRLASVVLAIVLLPSPTCAQAYLRVPDSGSAIALGLELPMFGEPDAFSFYTSLWEADALILLGTGTTLQVGFPLAIANADFVDGTSVYLGNVRASVLFGTPQRLDGFVGITLPTGSNLTGPDLAQGVGSLTWSTRAERWADRTFSLRGARFMSHAIESDRELGLGLGGAAVAANDFENLLVFARMDGWFRFPLGTWKLRVDLLTSLDVTGDDGLGRQVSAYLGFAAEWLDWPRPTVGFVRVPLDGDVRRELLASAGFSVMY